MIYVIYFGESSPPAPAIIGKNQQREPEHDPTTTYSLDLTAIRADFALDQEVHPGKRLIFLDSATSSQKPRWSLTPWPLRN
jgi:hypothetical protein